MKDILIIDDSSTSRLYYREILELLGCRVEEAINGLEGLEKLAGRRFDLIPPFQFSRVRMGNDV